MKFKKLMLMGVSIFSLCLAFLFLCSPVHAEGTGNFTFSGYGKYNDTYDIEVNLTFVGSYPSELVAYKVDNSNGYSVILVSQSCSYTYSGTRVLTSRSDGSIISNVSLSGNYSGNNYVMFNEALENVSTSLKLFDSKEHADSYLSSGSIDGWLNNPDSSTNLSQDEFVPPICTVSDRSLNSLYPEVSQFGSDLNPAAKISITDVVNNNDFDCTLQVQVKGSYYFADEPNTWVGMAGLAGGAQTYSTYQANTFLDWYDLYNEPFDGSTTSFKWYLLERPNVLGVGCPKISSLIGSYYSYFMSNGLTLDTKRILTADFSNFCDISETVRLRWTTTSYDDTGKKYCSDWVVCQLSDTHTSSMSSSDDISTTNQDGEETDNIYNTGDFSNSNSSSSQSFTEWLSDLFSGIGSLPSKFKTALQSLTTSGPNSVYTQVGVFFSWLPSEFWSLLTMGLLIVIILRILGR